MALYTVAEPIAFLRPEPVNSSSVTCGFILGDGVRCGNNSSSGSGCASANGTTVSFGSSPSPGASANGRRFFSNFSMMHFLHFFFASFKRKCIRRTELTVRRIVSTLEDTLCFDFSPGSERSLRSSTSRSAARDSASPSAQVLFSGPPYVYPPYVRVFAAARACVRATPFAAGRSPGRSCGHSICRTYTRQTAACYLLFKVQPAKTPNPSWRTGLFMPWFYCTCILGKTQQLTRCILCGFAPCRGAI